jgi:NAD(P)H-dependent FMN reductase
MKKVLVLGASSSKNSINKQLSYAASEYLKEVEAVKIDLSDYVLPMYSVDEESENGPSEKVESLNSLFKSVGGFIISLAEHNGSYTVAYKNLIDWISRQDGKVFNNKPVLLLSTSPGGRGGASVLESAKNIYPHMGASVVDAIALPSFFDNFKDGKIVENNFAAKIKDAVLALEKAV